MIPFAMLSRLHAQIIAAGVAINGVDNNGLVTPTSLQSAAQSTINAFDQTQAAQDAWVNLQARDLSKLLISADDPISKEIKALILVILDTFNRQSQQFRDLLAAIAAATSLVNLQTRAAAITPVEPARVAADIKTAMGNKLDAGLADG